MIDFDRPTGDELPLIYDNWTKSYKKSLWAGTVRNDMWESVQRATIQGLLARGADVRVALAPRVEGVFTGRRVMGWACFEPGVLHFLYVKADYRGQGIGRALLDHVTAGWSDHIYSHRTRASAFLPRHFRYDPVSARTR